MQLGQPDESGRARPVPIPGSEFTIEAACVIAAIGQNVEADTLNAPTLSLSKWGIAVDPRTLATNLPGVFAGGDAVTGPDLAVRAVAAGKLAAASLDQYLSGQKVIGHSAGRERGHGQAERGRAGRVPARNRAGAARANAATGDGQAAHDLRGSGAWLCSPAAATRESRRCLGCGCGKAIPCRLRQFATEYGVDPQRFVGERRHFSRDTSHPDIIFEPGKCIICGACVKVAAEAGEELGLSFVGRGFQVAVAAPFGRPMAEAVPKSGRRAAEVCPTGAIMLKGSGCAGCRMGHGDGLLGRHLGDQQARDFLHVTGKRERSWPTPRRSRRETARFRIGDTNHSDAR